MNTKTKSYSKWGLRKIEQQREDIIIKIYPITYVIRVCPYSKHSINVHTDTPLTNDQKILSYTWLLKVNRLPLRLAIPLSNLNCQTVFSSGKDRDVGLPHSLIKITFLIQTNQSIRYRTLTLT